MLTAFSVHRVFKEQEKSFWLARAEFGPAFLNLIPSDNEDNDNGLQFTCFSPGFMFSYHRQLRSLKPSMHYFEPVMRSNYLVAHAGTRYLFFDHQRLRGFMFELGLGFGFSMHEIKEYQLK